MKKDLTDFYTQSDHDLLDLVKFHQDLLHQSGRSGLAAEEDREKAGLLEKFRSLVDSRAMQRKHRYEEDQKEKKKLMDSRTNIDCPECNTLRAVKITGEEKSDPPGVMCDIVICSVCGCEFVNVMPNNWDDRIKFINFFIEELMTVRDSGETIAERILPPEESIALVEHFKKLKEAHIVAEEKREEMELAEKKADESLITIRDYLLEAKLAMVNFNGSKGDA